MRTKVLVAYVSTDGQTEKIARHIAQGFSDGGCDVDLRDIRSDSAADNITEFDAYYLGGSVRFGRHHRRLIKFVSKFRHHLERKRGVLFSVSGAAAAGKYARGTDEYVQKFLKKTRWRHSDHICIAGAVKYTQYDMFTRAMMKMIYKKEGGPTDTSRDFEMTDWDQVDAFICTELVVLQKLLEPQAA